MRQLAETTTCYANEFVWVAHNLARLRFFSNDIVGAVKIIDESLATNPFAKRDVLTLLAKAFLEFYSGRWGMPLIII